MKRLPPAKNNYNPSPLNTSSQALQYGRSQNIMGSLQTMAEQDQNNRGYNYSHLSKESADDMNKEYYKPAKYSKALQYKRARSYLKKKDDAYKQLDLFCDTDQLKYFGLGTYFYVELFRRLVWLFFTMTLVQGICIVINYKGDGLSNYESSFSTYLIKTTLGNYTSSSNLTGYDNILNALLPAVNFIALFIFVLIWRTHIRSLVNKQEEDNTDVKPEKFCVQFEGFDESDYNQEELKRFFSIYGAVYQASYVRNYENRLGHFEKLDQMQQEIRNQELQITLGGGSKKQVESLKKDKDALVKQAHQLQIHPSTISAYVHFQFQKTKKECLQQFKQHYLYSNKCSHICCRNFCCCCLPKKTQKVTFKNNKLMVREEKVPSPQDINWDHFEISACNRAMRGCIVFIVILLFLILSCTIIALCSIYISSHSKNCEGLNISSYNAITAKASGSQTILQCYCNAHLTDSLTDDVIKTTCADYLQGIYIEQSIQYAVIFIASLMNFLFGLIVDKLITCSRPVSQDAALSTKTAIYTIFLIINSIIVPIFIYADIFGFQASNYVSFITIISSDASNFFNVSTLSFYPNFTAVWYRNVSPLFTNYIIFNTLIVWVTFIMDKCCFTDKSNLQNKQGKILQKNMNRQIISYKLDVCKQAANLYLIVVMVLLFFTGIPIILLLGFLNVLSRYISNRSLLQKNSVRVQGLGQDFIKFSTTVLTLSLIIFPLIGEWMLVANTKISSDAQIVFGQISKIYSFGIYQLQKQLYLPFYIGITILTIVELIIYNTIIRFCSCLCSCCASPTPNYHSRPFGEYSKGMNVLCSYSIRKNDKMKNAVLYLQKYLTEK